MQWVLLLFNSENDGITQVKMELLWLINGSCGQGVGNRLLPT